MRIRITAVAVLLSWCALAGAAGIDRHELVTRHNLHLAGPGVVQVGNGEFAFTADSTGLQSVEPCCTMSQWGWHTAPLPEGVRVEGFRWTPKQTCAGRTVEYMAGEDDAISKWLYANPRRINLGHIGFRLGDAAAMGLKPEDIKDTSRTLDLWNGVLESRFVLRGQPVTVVTCCHPVLDAVAVRITSPLLRDHGLGVELAFPYSDLKEFGGYEGWDHPDLHKTEIVRSEENRADLARTLGEDAYAVTVAWSAGGSFAAAGAPHHYLIQAGAAEQIDLVVAFSPMPLQESLPGFEETRDTAAAYWNRFWSEGGAVDLSASTDPRWPELERRIVLSQYLTAVNCAGSLPPQESGLVNNGWNGKFHLEMYWWHGAHFALWDRWDLLDRSMGVYRAFLPGARATAARQGYRGARWPKCSGPAGRESPHPIHAMLIWQQPHPIFFAELDYRAHPTRETLEKWREIIDETADFMAALAVREPGTGRYVLGPPIYTVPETTDPDKVYNPAFELAYWRFGLETAREWHKRLGLASKPEWDAVLESLASLPQQDGVYLMEERLPNSYTNWNHNHPSVAGVLGVLPGPGVDRDTMRRTFDKVLDCWNWNDTWGWDFPMLAMTAARLGDPAKAVELLLHPNFGFDERGYPVGGGPWPYLPSSGGLLYAVGLMAGGWDGAPDRPAPGFPADGAWAIKVERIQRAP